MQKLMNVLVVYQFIWKHYWDYIMLLLNLYDIEFYLLVNPVWSLFCWVRQWRNLLFEIFFFPSFETVVHCCFVINCDLTCTWNIQKKNKNNSYISYILYICILIFIFFVWPFLHALSLFIYITIFVCLEQCSFVFSWWTCRSSDCFLFFTILIINLTSVCLCIRSDSCFRFFFLFLFKLINYRSKANLKDFVG